MAPRVGRSRCCWILKLRSLPNIRRLRRTWLRNPETGEIQSSLLSAGPAYMINANISDERKAVAWDYLQLAHGKQFARLLADQRGAGHRTSALTDPDLVANGRI